MQICPRSLLLLIRRWTLRDALLLLAGLLAVPMAGVAAQAQVPAPSTTRGQLSPWRFRADWKPGYSGWMSFPLSQDTGYDPSIYTETEGSRTLLMRTFTAHGEKSAWFGFVRPLQFQASLGTSCDLDYTMIAAGAVKEVTLVLGAADGRQFSFALPRTNGRHRVRVTGAQLGLKAPAPIVVVVLKALLSQPPLGSKSEWKLEQFGLDALRRPVVPLRAPKLNESSAGGQVADQVVKAGDPLRLAWPKSASPTRISLFAPSGEAAAPRQVEAGVAETEVPLPSSATGLWRAQVDQGSARTEFNFFVLGPTAPHPRVLLSERRLEQLRGPEYGSIRQQIHTRAGHLASTITYSVAAGDNIELMPSGPGIQPAYPDQIKPYFDLMDSYSGAVAYNALDYRLNGNATSLAAAKRALLTMTKWKTWEPPRFRAHGLQTYYEVGVAAQMVALGYDLIADHLSSEEKAAVEQTFWTQVIAPAVQEYFVADRNPIGASNFIANSVGGALAAAVAVQGDTPGWEQREGRAIAELEFSFARLLDGLFPGDGSEAEPTGYENFALQGLSWGMSALASLHTTPPGAARMMNSFWWPYYDTVTPGRQLDTGDFNGHLTKLPGFAWIAENAGIPELQAYYESGRHLDLSQGATAVNNGHMLEELPGPLDLVCCSAPAKAFPAPPPSRVFPRRGSAALRSGWGADSTLISLRVGPWFNHEHHDEGSFQVAAFGETLIDEAGYGRYYLDPHYPDYFTQAPGHNTVLIDGDAFSQQAINGRYWPGFTHPSFKSQLLAQRFDYLNADLTSAYNGKLESYRREYFFLKPGLLVVRDRIRAPHPHAFSWLLHVVQGSKVANTAAEASIRRAKASAALMALGPNARWMTATTPLPISLFDHLDNAGIQPHQELLLTSANAAATEFLVAMNFGPGADSNALRMERFREPAGEGVRAAGEHPAAMIFRSAPGALNIDQMSTDGSALLVSGAQGDGGTDWMAVEARVVQEGSRELLRSTSAVDVTFEHRGEALELTIHNDAKTVLRVYSAVAPKRVELDGRQVQPSYSNGMISLPLAETGEHHVSLR